jgi:DGQHR domain-containing protein
MAEKLSMQHGQEIDLGVCIIGRNLNIFTLRGYTSLEVLADISGGDVYDDVLNPEGTQRDLKPKHSKEALEYALGSLNVNPEESPRAFPEITLNVRDKAVLKISDLNSSEILFDSLDFMADGDSISVRVKVLSEKLTEPTPRFQPQISRVDGNHRLSQVENIDHEIFPEIPVVPFSMFVGLTNLQERKLFSDINGKHVGMPPSIVTTFDSSFTPAEVALTSNKGRATWLARKLTEDGMAFFGKVHFGGSTEGAKELYGAVPPVTVQGLRNGILRTLDSCPSLGAYLFPEVDLGDPAQNTDSKKRERIESGQMMVTLLNRYWTAVKNAYPTEWENKKDYILLNSIGLEGFSHLAGPVIEHLVLNKGTKDQVHFDAVMNHMASKTNLHRDHYKGVAGAGGGKKISNELMGIWTQSGVQIAVAISGLSSETTSALD